MNPFRHILLAFPLLFTFLGVQAQQAPCGTDLVEQMLLESDPGYLNRITETDRLLKSAILQGRQNSTRSSDTVIYTLPVVFHVLHQNGGEKLDQSRIYTELGNLNEAMRNVGFYDPSKGEDVRIEFCLAQIDPDGNFTTGIEYHETPLTVIGQNDDFTMKQQFNWDPTRYVNVYTARSLIGGGVAGYAYYPTNHGQFYDGIVLLYSIVGNNKSSSATFVHEVGHYLGLPHPFDRGCQNFDCLLDGDRVCDTPPDDPGVTFEGCITQNSCNTDADDPSPNNPFTSDVPDRNDVYMDYNNGTCRRAFTAGQTERMRAVVPNLRRSLLESQACSIPAGIDAALTGITAPSRTTCEANPVIAVDLRNAGLTGIVSLNLNYQLDGGTVKTQPWTGNLAYTQSVPVPLLLPNALSQGPHELKVWSSQPNGGADQFTLNDTVNLDFYYQPLRQVPFIEKFDAGIPADWAIDNPEGLSWEYSPVSACDTGSASVFFNNSFSYASGISDALITPEIDLTNVSSAMLSFDIAYPYDSRIQGFREAFEVQVSYDCGLTWDDQNPLFEGDRNGLATAFIASDTVGLWAPGSCNEWATVSLDISFLQGQKVMFRFLYLKFDNGFPIYLDNVQIDGVTAVDPELAGNLRLFPNPASDQVVLDFGDDFSGAVEVSLHNLAGQQVRRRELEIGPSGRDILEVSGLPRGIYLLQARTDRGQYTQKLMVE